MQVKLDDIEWAIEFASFGIGDHEAFINLVTGHIYYVGDGVDELPPSDLYESDDYLQIPGKTDLRLGKPLAIDFVANSLPDKLDMVYTMFSRRGAYSKFKSLLESEGQIKKWYAYEEAEIRKATIEWCKENGINLSSDKETE